ncbi:hypothetical protein, partial [Stieleria mannarensis]|uniref:hypothetical protein n=1 Tax=Stieleria mannarensis TaxID=2755585 RepID=UPI0016036A9B
VLKCVQRERDGTAGALGREHLLAAEIFGYSFANYRDHLGIGNVRFEDLMPDDAKVLQQAVTENWPLTRVAAAMNTDTDNAASLIDSAKDAIKVVDAATPADSFRMAVRQLVQTASEQGLNTEQDVDNLVTQICYRVSDLSVLLDLDDSRLSDYSRALREESDETDDADMDESP